MSARIGLERVAAVMHVTLETNSSRWELQGGEADATSARFMGTMQKNARPSSRRKSLMHFIMLRAMLKLGHYWW